LCIKNAVFFDLSLIVFPFPRLFHLTNSEHIQEVTAFPVRLNLSFAKVVGKNTSSVKTSVLLPLTPA
jgi:hypothetical protein